MHQLPRCKEIQKLISQSINLIDINNQWDEVCMDGDDLDQETLNLEPLVRMEE